MTSSLLTFKFFKAFSNYSSLVPFEYVLAVSKKLIPKSRACFTISSVCFSSKVQSCIVPAFPKLIHPKHTLDTFIFVCPNVVYFKFITSYLFKFDLSNT